MSITEIYKAMSVYTQAIGNIMIVGGFAGMVVLGKAIFEAYMPKEADRES